MSNQQVVPFNFRGLAVRTLSENNIPLFCLRDVCVALDIFNSSDVVKRLDSKGVSQIDTLSNGGICDLDSIDVTSKARKTQMMTFINEPNLYRVIFRSDKPQAKDFQNWVFEEVLPAIRQTGKYDARAELTIEQKHIALLEKHIQLLENGVSRRTSKASPLFQLDPPQKAVVDAWLQKSFNNGYFRGCGLGMWVDKVQSALLFDSYEFYCVHHNVPKYKWIGIAQLSRYLKTIYPKIKIGYSRDRGFNFGTLHDAIHAFANANGGVQ